VPHRAPAPVARQFIAARFPEPWLRLSPAELRRFVLLLDSRQITGGAVYDALAAATAVSAGAEIATLDLRASQTYQRIGAKFRLLG
jgi:predicted nucleic acid-binding protein